MLNRAFARKLSIFVFSGCAIQLACAAENPYRDVYWGDLQVRTSWSNKAFVNDVRIDPQAAYRYARGEKVANFAGQTLQLSKPLDFVAIADDADYLGIAALANREESDVAKLLGARTLRPKRGQNIEKIYPAIEKELLSGQLPHSTLRSSALTRSVWQQYLAVTEHFNQPGKFTTFPAFTWTSRADAMDSGRVILFADSQSAGERPATRLTAPEIDKLYDWLDSRIESGAKALAIPFGVEHAASTLDIKKKKNTLIDDDVAIQRSRNESLQMAMYSTSSSETLPLLSTDDEFANFENGLIDLERAEYSSFIRHAYFEGIANEDSRGFNPYRFGLVGGSGTYNGVSEYLESNYLGYLGKADAIAEERLNEANKSLRQFSGAGLTAIWAKENTREALFSAMQNNETYVTSGSRIKLRVFGAWNLPDNPFNRPDWVKLGYEQGVPMGGMLSEPPRDGAPHLMIYAERDPEGAKLDRVQVVKGWTQNGQVKEKIYDVVWAGDRKIDPATGKLPSIGSSVDVAKATYSNAIGADKLLKVWKDPDFDPRLHAVYYVRILEIPTPRWTTYDAARLGVAPPTDVPSLIQERAIATPIWYQPSSSTRQNFKAGLTVPELLQMGAKLVDDKTLKQVFVGKKLRIRNLVDGQYFEVAYTDKGERTILNVNGVALTKSVSSDPMFGLQVGRNQPYVIKDQKVVLTISGKSYSFAVYKDATRYVLAASPELGYANYVIEKIF